RLPRRPGDRAERPQPAGRRAHGARLRPLEEVRRGKAGQGQGAARAHPRHRGAFQGRGRDRQQGARRMTATVATVFAIVYVGMILGGLPFLQLDRTGVALLGAIAIVGLEVLTPEQAALSIHLPTLLLLFSFMVLSAQMRLGGFYTWVTLRIAALPLAPAALLAAIMAVVAALAAVFSNDVVCLAVAPVLVEACARRRLNPVPFLIGLACAANVGSAATLIGNPQNMLIGQVLNLPFAAYLREAIAPVLLGLAASWAIIAWQLRSAQPTDAPLIVERRAEPGQELDRWQSAKGLAVALA